MSVPKKKRRTYLPAAERRDQILDCALEAFAEAGYHATSIADVCSRAGIGRGTLYQYFDDKRALLEALAERITKRIVKSFSERERLRVPPGFKPTRQQAIQFVEQRFAEVLRAVFEDAATARLVLRAGRGADGVVDGILRRIDEAAIARIEEELRAAKEAGVIRPVDEHFVARFFLGGVEKIVLAYIEDDRPIDIQAIAREAALLEVLGIYPDE
jgi:AcrR family transcriptional regulator